MIVSVSLLFLRFADRETPGAPVATSGADAIYRARLASGELTPFERMMLARKKQVLKNEDILLLHSSGADRSVLLKMIQTSGAAYDLSPGGVLQLKKAGIDDVVIMAMIDRAAVYGE